VKPLIFVCFGAICAGCGGSLFPLQTGQDCRAGRRDAGFRSDMGAESRSGHLPLGRRATIPRRIQPGNSSCQPMHRWTRGRRSFTWAITARTSSTDHPLSSSSPRRWTV